MGKAKEPKVTKRQRPAGQLVGYLRVSSLDQKELRQLDGFTLDKRFMDKASGKDLHRPQLKQLTGYVREGDTVICHSMDRLARNLDDLRKVVLGFTDRGVHVRFEKENLTFTGESSPMSHLLLNVMGAFAQFERDLIRERQREGIALAKLREGAYVGRKHCLNPAQAKDHRRRVAARDSKTALAGELGSAVRLYIDTSQEQGCESWHSTRDALSLRSAESAGEGALRYLLHAEAPG